MKCECCGKSIGLFNKVVIKDTEYVCKDCFSKWGFTKEDLKTDRYRLKSWRFLQRGKAECDAMIDRAEYEKTHTKVKKVVLGDVDDPKIEKILNAAKSLVDADELYGGWTDRELKEEENENRHHIYGGIDFDCELKDGVYLEGERVADLPEIEELKEFDCTPYLIINGGKYKQLVYDDDGECEIVKGTNPYWLMLKLVYVD